MPIPSQCPSSLVTTAALCTLVTICTLLAATPQHSVSIISSCLIAGKIFLQLWLWDQVTTLHVLNQCKYDTWLLQKVWSCFKDNKADFTVMEKCNARRAMNTIRTITRDKELHSLQNFLLQIIKKQMKKYFLQWMFTFSCLFLMLRIFLAIFNDVEWCAIPWRGITSNRFGDLVWAEKWRKRAEADGKIHLMIINTWLTSLSEESVQFFHPEGQRKLQPNWLLVWIGQNCKENNCVSVHERAQSSSHFASYWQHKVTSTSAADYGVTSPVMVKHSESRMHTTVMSSLLLRILLLWLNKTLRYYGCAILICCHCFFLFIYLFILIIKY